MDVLGMILFFLVAVVFIIVCGIAFIALLFFFLILAGAGPAIVAYMESRWPELGDDDA